MGGSDITADRDVDSLTAAIGGIDITADRDVDSLTAAIGGIDITAGVHSQASVYEQVVKTIHEHFVQYRDLAAEPTNLSEISKILDRVGYMGSTPSAGRRAASASTWSSWCSTSRRSTATQPRAEEADGGHRQRGRRPSEGTLDEVLLVVDSLLPRKRTSSTSSRRIRARGERLKGAHCVDAAGGPVLQRDRQHQHARSHPQT